MLSLTQPSAQIVLDVTAVDTGHRTRGIGRYASELWRAAAQLDDEVVALRMAPAERSWCTTLPERHLPRFIQSQRVLGADLKQAGCKVFGATEPWTLPRQTRGLRVVPTCHDVIPLEFAAEYGGWDNAKWSLYFRWVRTTDVLNDCPAIIVPSEATKSALSHYIGVDPDRVVVIPHGVDHERFRPAPEADVASVRSRLNLGSEPYLLYVGGYDFRKNIVRLVEAFAASGRSDDLLLVLGGDAATGERDVVLDAAERAGVLRRVVWTGRIDDEELPPLYTGAHAFVYPSLSEGFGLQVLEAMACGCPVITSNDTALQEVAGEAALAVEPDRVDSIAEAFRSLDLEACGELSRRGIDRAASFSWERTAQATLDVYRAALE